MLEPSKNTQEAGAKHQKSESSRKKDRPRASQSENFWRNGMVILEGAKD